VLFSSLAFSLRFSGAIVAKPILVTSLVLLSKCELDQLSLLSLKMEMVVIVINPSFIRQTSDSRAHEVNPSCSSAPHASLGLGFPSS
jgi:hypothetical protein